MRLIAAVQEDGKSRAVKSLAFRSHTYLGDSLNIIEILNALGAQEIAFIDLEASRTRNIDYDKIERYSEQVNVPFLYGGGIDSTTDVRKLAGLGVERFLISRFLGDNNQIVKKLVEYLGSSSVSISMDIETLSFQDETTLCKLRGHTTFIRLETIVDALIELEPGDLVIRFVELDGSDGTSAMSLYKQLIDNPAFSPLVGKMEVLAGTGVRNIDLARKLTSQLKLDGIMAGSMFCFSKSGGILTSYPKECSVLNP